MFKTKLILFLILTNFTSYTLGQNYFKSFVNLTHQAYQACYHYFCPPANYPKNYSINLMWINNQLDTQQELLFPATIAPRLKQNTIETILDWAKKNSTCQINIWFDSQLVTKQAIKNTLTLIKLETLKYQDIAPIKLKDVRKLRLVQDHPEIFTALLPVYFRVDLVRVIAILETISKKHDLYFVYSDLDIKPINKHQVFDQKSIALLDNHHFIMAKANSTLGFENGFQIFKYDQNLVNGLEKTIIGPCLLSAYEFLQQNDMASNQLKRAYFQETVFRAYPDLFQYLDKLANKPTGAIPTKKIKLPSSTSKAFELLKDCS